MVCCMSFFDHYPRFYQTSHTSPWPHRLNARHTAIIERNASFLKGARVLDIASHDGRWSFAALQAGASHVVGIEPRSELIANARDTFDHYGVESGRYDFRQGDVFGLLAGDHFDVVLCLGYYYHTIRHAELLDKIERTAARLVVIDTEVTPRQDQIAAGPSGDPRLVFRNPNMVQMLLDPVEDQQMACADSLTRNGRTLVGRPSRMAVEFMAHHFGYECAIYDWIGHFADNREHEPAMVDYSEGWRDTFYLSR